MSSSNFFFVIINCLIFRKVYAQWIESTNLLLVVIRQGSRSHCYDPTHCAMSSPPLIPFGFKRILRDSAIEDEEMIQEQEENYMPQSTTNYEDVTLAGEEHSCASTIQKKRKNVMQCLRDDFLEVNLFLTSFIHL